MANPNPNAPNPSPVNPNPNVRQVAPGMGNFNPATGKRNVVPGGAPGAIGGGGFSEGFAPTSGAGSDPTKITWPGPGGTFQMPEGGRGGFESGRDMASIYASLGWDPSHTGSSGKPSASVPNPAAPVAAPGVALNQWDNPMTSPNRFDPDYLASFEAGEAPFGRFGAYANNDPRTPTGDATAGPGAPSAAAAGAYTGAGAGANPIPGNQVGGMLNDPAVVDQWLQQGLIDSDTAAILRTVAQQNLQREQANTSAAGFAPSGTPAPGGPPPGGGGGGGGGPAPPSPPPPGAPPPPGVQNPGRGPNPLPPDVLQNLAKFYGIPIEDLQSYFDLFPQAESTPLNSGNTSFDTGDRANVTRLMQGKWIGDPFNLPGAPSATGMGLNAIEALAKEQSARGEAGEARMQQLMQRFAGDPSLIGTERLSNQLANNPFLTSSPNLQAAQRERGIQDIEQQRQQSQRQLGDIGATAGPAGQELSLAAENQANRARSDFDLRLEDEYAMRKRADVETAGKQFTRGADVTRQMRGAPEAAYIDMLRQPLEPYRSGLADVLLQIGSLQSDKSLALRSPSFGDYAAPALGAFAGGGASAIGKGIGEAIFA